MALFINKLFSSRKKAYHKHQDVCERAFTFSQDQVRVVLFRECDFRGRKLLFDSQSVQKIPIPVTVTKPQTATGIPSLPNKNEVFVEISNGYGYQYIRPSGDIVQLGEMVFGSVAMSFRGTSLKIHSFSSPAKLMCTQVFPSPRHPIRGRISVTSHNFDAIRSNSSVHSFDKSVKLDCSSASSTTSFNEQVSVYSTDSDIKIATPSGSVPLDVPTSNQSMTNTKLAPSLEGDSGFCGEQSYSSVSSGPPSMCLWDTRHEHASLQGFSCGSLYKRWLRSTSTSLDYNACSDSSLSGVHSSASADECMTRGHHRSSKLGLAVIIRLSEGQEIELERFLLEHSALIEAMVCRARAGAESAYTKPGNFASLMYEVYNEASQWLTDLATGPIIAIYLWHSLGSRTQSRLQLTCDNKAKNSDITKTKSESSLVKNNSKTNLLLSDRTRNNLLLRSSLLEIASDNASSRRASTRLFSNDFLKLDERWKSARVNPICMSDTSLNAERFVRELCELLESVDTKHTNFFISTLLTAVLTNHLGWVSTVLPPSQTDKDSLSKLHAPCNPLWGQLSDLYGAVGSPTKIAHTVVCGNNKNEIIVRILNVLTYFIRCSVVERNFLFRYSSVDENTEADNICLKDVFKETKSDRQYLDTYNNIRYEHTSENKYKNKQDVPTMKTEELEMSTLKTIIQDDSALEKGTESKCFGLTRTKSCLGSLTKQINAQEENTVDKNESKESNGIKLTTHPLLDKVTSLGISAEKSPDRMKNNFKVFDCFQEEDIHNLIDIKEASDQIRKVFLPKPVKLRKENSYTSLSKLNESETHCEELKIDDSNKENNVVFVLGDNDRLVGLKKCPSNLNNTMLDNNNEKQQTNNEKTSLLAENTQYNIPSCSNQRPKDLKIPLSNTKRIFQSESEDSSPDTLNCRHSSSSDTSPCSECEKNQRDIDIFKLRNTLLVRPSKLVDSERTNKIVMTRSSVINLETETTDLEKTERRRDEFNRSQSVPPSDKNQRKCSKNGCKKKYSGVKFDFKQYPQIVTNYMKSKNLEMSQLHFAEKTLKLSRSFSASLYDCSKFEFPSCDCEPHSEETLQTPSNASELEFTSELANDRYETHRARERRSKAFAKTVLPTADIKNPYSFTRTEVDFDHPLQEITGKEDNAIFEHDIDTYETQAANTQTNKMNFIELPMPRMISQQPNAENSTSGYTQTLLRGVSDKYISDMVLQGTTCPPKCWEHILKRDLCLAARKPLLDQPIQEAVAIVANTDTWEVQLVSSHTYVVERGSSGIRVGMSQLIANMLESLLHMWKLRTPPEYCLMHIESRLRELCIRSKALAQLLMTTEFCNMDLLTSALQLEVNDVPLLMSVASTHTPQVTQKYGLSFQ
ncbi:uncharacterized protein CBL_06006 [Carabus blaptoides fortunei]